MIVSASFEITEQWRHAENGMIEMPTESDEIIAGHCVALCGFDLVHRYLIFENSWGMEWGKNGRGVMPFEYFDKYLISSWQPHGIVLKQNYFQFSGVGQVIWGMPDWLGHTTLGGDIIHGREVFDGSNNERMGWAFVVHRGGFLDIEDLFVRPQYRRQGIGYQLIEMLLELAQQLNRPLRLWVPFADWNESSITVVEKIAEKLGLRMVDPGVRWAAALGVAKADGLVSQESRPAKQPSLPLPPRVRNFVF
jgi:GNAT superfamily N-acetyltransferase